MSHDLWYTRESVCCDVLMHLVLFNHYVLIILMAVLVNNCSIRQLLRVPAQTLYTLLLTDSGNHLSWAMFG